jgi:hypothetical protein
MRVIRSLWRVSVAIAAWLAALNAHLYSCGWVGVAFILLGMVYRGIRSPDEESDP